MVGANTAAGAGHANPATPVERDERRLRLWAEATSPYGHGLPLGAVWKLTPREYLALQHVREMERQRWAIERADFRNAHFVGAEGVPWEPGDFLGTGNREQRQMEKGRSELAAAQANAQLMSMRKGDPEPEGLPDWAKG